MNGASSSIYYQVLNYLLSQLQISWKQCNEKQYFRIAFFSWIQLFASSGKSSQLSSI